MSVSVVESCGSVSGYGTLHGMARAITVYCSSSDQIDRGYFDAAEALGAALGARGDTLVYGGGRIGLMGALARAVHAHGGRVVGVIPESMKSVEVAYTEADELLVTETMRQRKQLMEDRGDAFVVLPGGFGTLEELLEIITGRVLRHHAKPVVLLNCQGFYDHLLELFDRLYATGFARRKDFPAYHVAADAPDALRQLDAAPTPPLSPRSGG